jgi:cytidine deaminase
MDYKNLIDIALEVRRNAYAPYSSFLVGSALLTKSGKIYTGCNVENGSYGGTICAERVAFTKAISEGEREFCAIAIVGGKGDDVSEFTPPCGICLQFMSEFCQGDFEVILSDGKDNEVFTLSSLLPKGFKL